MIKVAFFYEKKRVSSYYNSKLCEDEKITVQSVQNYILFANRKRKTSQVLQASRGTVKKWTRFVRAYR
ncbi:hypothetical protein EEL30_10580 [Brevibacillus laterosporus]|uniref:Uncharacterized protein n=1 Tax=Brevibacillus laterosporus TaxID=1465 RepID=A0A518V6Q9_BRELA|nr:hypothetical protein EEL30_10580 [Brevibacillus laterosporus]